MHICLLTADGTKGGIEKHILHLSTELETKREDEMYTSLENALKNLTLQTIAAETQSVYKSLGGREN